MSEAVTLNLVQIEETVPAPDNLTAGPKGVTRTDIAKVRLSAGVLKRGTLLTVKELEGERIFVPCAAADLAVMGTEFAILADTLTSAADDRTAAALYFSGDFNVNAVIFPWEAEGDDHMEQAELARETLRRHKIFLRASSK
jgi:hypothetical protein